jgi:hypothetical protein
MLQVGLLLGLLDICGHGARPAAELEALDQRAVLRIAVGERHIGVDVVPLVGAEREAHLALVHTHFIEQPVDDGLLQLGETDASGLLTIAVGYIYELNLRHANHRP